MSYIVHPVYLDALDYYRFILQCTETGGFAGYVFPASANESPMSFSHGYGSISYPDTVINWSEFPQLAEVPFYTIEYAGLGEMERIINLPEYAHIRHFLRAEGKFSGYFPQLKNQAPNISFLWHYTPPNLKGSWYLPAGALWVNEQGCWLGNRDGLILAFNHEGEITHFHQLSRKVSHFVADKNYFYASCDDGQIYELSGKFPDIVYNARSSHHPYGDFFIVALQLWESQLTLVDVYGTITQLDTDFQVKWQKKLDIWRGLALNMTTNPSQLYLGHSKGVNCYDFSKGKLIWQQPTHAPILWGEVWKNQLIVGSSDGGIYILNSVGNWKTPTTTMEKLAVCDDAVYAGTVVSEQELIWAGDCLGNLYQFNLKGELLAKYNIGNDAVLSLNWWGDRLYGVTCKGMIFAFIPA